MSNLSKLSNLSLKERLTILMATVTGLTFLCSFLVFFLFERAALRQGLVRDLKTQAQVLSQVVAADLDFGNLLDSNKSLQFLASNQHILAARIFDADGQVFTTRTAKGYAQPLPDHPPEREFARFHDGVLDLFLLVRQDGQFKGTLFVRSDLLEIQAGFLTAVKVISAAGLGLLVLVLVAASLLQRQVSEPILNLAETARKVSLERDFSIRLQRTQGGEIGVLSESFNEMLNHIQERDAKLLEYQDHLEDLVFHRSEQLLQTKQLLTATLDALPAYIAILDGAGVVLATNLNWGQFSNPDNGFIHQVQVGNDYKEVCERMRAGPGPSQGLAEGLLEVLTGAKETLYLEYELNAQEKHQWFTVLMNRFSTADSYHIVLMHMDISDQKLLEIQLSQAQKLESIGQLAAGIAHEINTPTQFIGDNLNFLRRSFEDILELLVPFENLLADPAAGEARLAACRVALEQADLDYLKDEIPKGIDQCLEGVGRVAKIVNAMKEFSHPGSVTKKPVNLNQAIETTALVCRSEWKYVAEMEMDLDRELPDVPCLPDPFNQVILNLLINSSYAIAKKNQGTDKKGLIKVSTRAAGPFAEISVEDSGTGIPEEILSRIFDPFFTTKPVGKGTGQGLAIAFSVIVKQHGGSISVKSDLGKGATFTIRLPMGA